MKPYDLISIDLGEKPKNGRSKAFSPVRILVPIDSAGNAFNSLAYTIRLAKAWKAGIHLFYIIDIDEVPISESAVMVEGAMNRLEAKASTCLQSLRELIHEMGVEVISAESEIGSVKSLLQKKIESAGPDMIVTGQSGVHKGLLNSLVRQATCPVLIVPDAATPGVPLSVLLWSDQGDLSDLDLKSMEAILKRSRQLHILSNARGRLRGPNRVGGEEYSIHLHTAEGAEPLKAIQQFVQDHPVDLVCSFLPEQSFLQRILGQCVPLELARQLSIPVLILR